MVRAGVAVAAILVGAAGCGSDDGERVSRADLERWLVDEGGLAAAEADCVADAMFAAGLDQDELRQFVELDRDMSPEEYREAEPDRIDVYTEARVQCDGSFEKTGDAIEDAN